MASEPNSSAESITKSYAPTISERLSAPTGLRAASTGGPAAADGHPATDDNTAKAAGKIVSKLLKKRRRSKESVGMNAPRKLTIIKKLERNFLAIFKLGRTEYTAKEAKLRVSQAEQALLDGQNHARDLERRLKQLELSANSNHHDLTQLRQTVDGAIQEFRSERAFVLDSMRAETSLMARVFADLSRRVDQLSERRSSDALAGPAPGPSLPASEGFDAFKDSFYHRLENRYRGSVEEISNRLRLYLPDAQAAFQRTGDKPALDIGCGRGEWLGLLKRAGIEGFGIDTNPVQIEAAKEQGLDVRLGDALEALSRQADNSLSMITAHHLVEHLPFDAVAWIAREAERVLAPGGILLFETPHTRNVLVGATTFHTDPTHLKPMPEQVLSVLFDTAGFDPVEIRALNPHERFKEFLDKPDFNDELAFLLFGPQDLAVLGTKPLTEKD